MRTMITSISILVLVVFVTILPAIADEQFERIEMGESGQFVEFKLSPEEISAKINETQTVGANNKTKVKKADQGEKVFEMGESGQIVSFPMTEQEIAAKNAQKAQLKAEHNHKATRAERGVIIFEMAESGQTIEFPEELVEILIDGVAEGGVKINEVLSKDQDS